VKAANERQRKLPVKVAKAANNIKYPVAAKAAYLAYPVKKNEQDGQDRQDGRGNNG
jgi:hypothetical protein